MKTRQISKVMKSLLSATIILIIVAANVMMFYKYLDQKILAESDKKLVDSSREEIKNRTELTDVQKIIDSFLNSISKNELKFSPLFFVRDNNISLTHKIADSKIQIIITTPLKQQLFEEVRFNQPGEGMERVRNYCKEHFGIVLSNQQVGDFFIISRIADTYANDKSSTTQVTTLYDEDGLKVEFSKPGYHLPRQLIINRSGSENRIQLGYDLYDYHITDLDGDGLKEIILCGSKCPPQSPLTCWSNRDVYTSDYSYLSVFTETGDIKKTGRKRLNFINYYGTHPKFLHFAADSLLFVGFYGNEEQNWENMNIVNLRNGRLKDLGITYEDIIGFFTENDRPGFVRSIGGNQYEKVVIDESYNLQVLYRKQHNFGFSDYIQNQIKLSKRVLSIYFPPVTIVDEKGETLFQYKESVGYEKISESSIKLLFPQAEKYERIIFKSKYQLDSDFFRIFLVEITLLILLVSYLRWRRVTNPPRNYLRDTIYFGFLHHIRLYGHIKRQVDIPQRFFFSSNKVTALLKSISNNYSERNVRFFFPFEMHIYELEPDSELNIIQEIAHDLKNEILSLKLIMKKQGEVVENSLDNSFRKLRDIVNLSRSPNLEKSSMNSIVKSIILRMSGHPHYEKLQLNLTDDRLINVDKNLLETALDNYITNAFEAINEAGYIKVETVTKDNQHRIIIENSLTELHQLDKLGTLGYSTKTNGSGCGLIISRRIIEKFGGFVNLEIDQEKMIFRIEIGLMV